MSKKGKRNIMCPSCGEPVKEPYKTWELISPFPDKKMRITITVFGMFQCPKCGRKFRGVVAKAKVGGDYVEV